MEANGGSDRTDENSSFLYSDSRFIVGTEIQVNSSWSKRIQQKESDGEIGPHIKKQAVWTNGLKHGGFSTKHICRFWEILVDLALIPPTSQLMLRKKDSSGNMKGIIFATNQRPTRWFQKDEITSTCEIHMAIVAASSLGYRVTIIKKHDNSAISMGHSCGIWQPFMT